MLVWRMVVTSDEGESWRRDVSLHSAFVDPGVLCMKILFDKAYIYHSVLLAYLGENAATKMNIPPGANTHVYFLSGPRWRLASAYMFVCASGIPGSLFLPASNGVP